MQGVRIDRNIKIYRSVCAELVKKHGKSFNAVDRDLGRGSSWLTKRLGGEYGMFEHMEVFAIASVIGCTKEELTSVPARFEAQEQAQKAQEATPPQTMALNAELSEALKEIRHMVSALGMTNPKQSQIAKIHEDMRDIAKMLHTDIRNLIETMDKYWKPQPPKYQVKDREER